MSVKPNTGLEQPASSSHSSYREGFLSIVGRSHIAQPRVEESRTFREIRGCKFSLMRYKIRPFITLLLLITMFVIEGNAFAKSALEQGEELFLNNQMEEAKPFLETALNQDPTNERIYLYLATVYEALGQSERAVIVLQRGIQYSITYLDVMYYNIANNMFNQTKNVLAFEMYTKALQVNPDFSEAYLNRANTALRVDNFTSALHDYVAYLEREPFSSQRESIERVIDALRTTVEDQRRIAEEQERVRQEAANRKRALLDSVLNSLQNASSSTTNLSAETEDVEQTDEESDIVD
jgi:tetratricopeptide (TPR) repeat protein